jgi:hypothetical protein
MAAELTARELRPFKFLEYFSEGDQARFAGRDWEIGVLAAGIAASRTYILFGRSGLGKTSLLLAGVFPRLRERGIRPVYLRVLADPISEVLAAISRDVAPVNRETVAEVLREHAPVALVFDQFEELFIRYRNRPAQRAALGEMIADLAAKVPSLTIVFSLREDFLGEIEEFKTYVPHLGEQSFRLLPLTAFGARQAIVLPLESCDVAYEEKLVTELIEESAKNGFDPLLLQIICSEIWKEATTQGPNANSLRLTTGHLKAVGGFEGIFRRYVQSVTTDLAESLHLVARAVLDALITAEATKYTLRKQDLIADREAEIANETKAALGQERARNPVYVMASVEEISVVLEHLEARRIVRRIGDGEDSWYELLHDRLGPVLRDWFRTDRDFVDFQFARTFIASLATSSGERYGSAHLMSVKQLADIVDPWRERLRINAAEAEFVLRSSIATESSRSDYWALRLEQVRPGRTAEVVDELLKDGDAGTRRTAAAQLPLLADTASTSPTLCLKTALDDSDAEVRAAAAGAFATIARGDDIRQLLATVGHRGRRVVEVVAAFYEANRSAADFPYWVRLAAWRQAQKMRLAIHRERIRSARNTGAAAGAISSLLWSGTIGLWLVVVFKWTLFAASTNRGAAEARILLLFFGGFAGAITVIGSLLGYLIGGRAARRVAFGKWETWSGSVTRGVLQYLCTFLLAAAIAYPLVVVTEINDIAEIFLPSFVLLVVVSAVIALSSSNTRRTEERDRDWGASAALRATVLIPPFVLAAIGAVIIPRQALKAADVGDSNGDARVFAVVIAAIIAASLAGAVGGAMTRRVNVYPQVLGFTRKTLWRMLAASSLPLLAGAVGVALVLNTQVHAYLRATLGVIVLTSAIVLSFRVFNAGSCLLRLLHDTPEADLPRQKFTPKFLRALPATSLIALALASSFAVCKHGTPLNPHLIDATSHKSAPESTERAVFTGWSTARYYTIRGYGLLQYRVSGNVNSYVGSEKKPLEFNPTELTIGEIPVTVMGSTPLQQPVSRVRYTLNARTVEASNQLSSSAPMVLSLHRINATTWFGEFHDSDWWYVLFHGITEPLRASTKTRHLVELTDSENGESGTLPYKGIVRNSNQLTPVRLRWKPVGPYDNEEILSYVLQRVPPGVRFNIHREIERLREVERLIVVERLTRSGRYSMSAGRYEVERLRRLRREYPISVELQKIIDLKGIAVKFSPEDATELPNNLDLFFSFAY